MFQLGYVLRQQEDVVIVRLSYSSNPLNSMLFPMIFLLLAKLADVFISMISHIQNLFAFGFDVTLESLKSTSF